MPIRKRSNRAFAEPEDGDKLVIVAKPKKPMPEGGLFNGDEDRSIVQMIGASGGDEGFTLADRVQCMRTPYDKDNPQEIRYRNRVRNRGTAITAFCITCTGGRKAVTECLATTCPLWAFRFGGDPFYGKRK